MNAWTSEGSSFDKFNQFSSSKERRKFCPVCKEALCPVVRGRYLWTSVKTMRCSKTAPTNCRFYCSLVPRIFLHAPALNSPVGAYFMYNITVGSNNRFSISDKDVESQWVSLYEVEKPAALPDEFKAGCFHKELWDKANSEVETPNGGYM